MPIASPHVLSVNLGKAVASPHTNSPTGTSGIDKHPADEVQVRAPGPKEGGLGSGVVGDGIGDQRFHGGDNKAVYLYSREELDWWEAELGRELRCGLFGENVTTRGLDVDSLVVGSTIAFGGGRDGAAVLTVAGPRIPCRTFAGHLGERGWVKRFSAHGRSGAYCAVQTPGSIRTGDAIDVSDVPGHGITVPDLFRALTGDLEQIERVLAARLLADAKLAQLAESFERRTGRRVA